MIRRLRSLVQGDAPLDIPPFGGGMTAPVQSPYHHYVTVSRLTGLGLAIRTTTVCLMVLNVLLAIFAVAAMRSTAHVADGSRFGCIITPLEDAARSPQAQGGGTP